MQWRTRHVCGCQVNGRSTMTEAVKMRLARVREPVLGILDQAISSATNFILVVLAARSLGIGDFGVFAAGLAAGLLAIGVNRSVTAEPLLVQQSSRSESERNEAIRLALGLALANGVLAAVLAAPLLLIGGVIGAIALVFALGAGALFIQDTLRFAFFLNNRPNRAIATDGIWGIALVLGFWTLHLRVPMSAASFLALWVGSSMVATIAGLALGRYVPTWRGLLSTIRDNWRVSRSFLGEFVTIRASGHLTLYAVGLTAGSSGMGALKGGQTLYGPLTVVFGGLRAVMLPHAVRSLDTHNRQALWRVCVSVSGLAGLAVIGWALVALVLPDGLGEEILGDTWGNARRLVLPLGLWKLGSAWCLGALIGQRAMMAMRESLRTRMVVGILLLGGGLGGASLGGAVGAAWGLAVASMAGGGYYWWRARATIEGDKFLTARERDLLRQRAEASR
jgi:O-antigen/teichoic acid export membrane protein